LAGNRRRPSWSGISQHGYDQRLGEPCGACLSSVEHDGCRVLPCGAGGGARPVRQAGDLQHRPEPAPAKAGGGQFTSADFTGMLAEAGIRISMDGRGRWMDNVLIERLWRSLKHEDIYLKGYADGREAKAGIGDWIAFCNSRRPHQALGNRTPMTLWREGTTGPLAENAVDMMDNARAWPTCPQPKQQQTFNMIS